MTEQNSLAVMPVMDTSLAVSRRDQVVSFVKSIMVEGTDFGAIPGTEKATLLKPGAEKLTTFFGLSKRFEIIERIEDWTGQEYGEPFFYYLYRCQLLRGDLLVAESDGSCNSFEAKYRWRWVGIEDVPPHLNPDSLATRKAVKSEFEFAINKRQTTGKYGKTTEYWDEFEAAIAAGDARQTNRKTTKGKEFPAWEIETVAYRVPNPDVASQVNTIQKMAQKRALVAATLLAVNASEFFTQDLEDFDNQEIVTVEAEPVKSTKPKKKDGNGRNHIDRIFESVQKATNNYYQAKEHLYNVLGGWPQPDDEVSIEAAIQAAIRHASADADKKADEDELPF